MHTEAAGPAEYAGPAVAAILAVDSVDDVLRFAFPEAQSRGVDLHILITGDAAAISAVRMREPVDRWAEKYPDVRFTVTAQPDIDPAITLVAAARQGSLLVVAEPACAHDRAVLEAVTRRLRCPISRRRRRAASPAATGDPAPSGRHDGQRAPGSSGEPTARNAE